MHLIKDKRYKRICKWIATVLVIVLLVNQSCFSVLAEEITEPEEVPVQAETQEQQDVDVPEMTVQEPVETEPEIPVSQESGMGNENTEQSDDDPQTELDNTSYVDETETDLEPDTEMESGSETEESSEITMTEPEIVIADEMAVATQEELAVALLAGASKITLTADISLTTTMIVPAVTDIVLDGQGFSLYRGADENGAFIGTMLYLNGVENAEEISGSLTLTNICVDGQNAGNRVGSSAIIDYGSLILDEGAVVKSNYNYGTYLSNESGEKEVVIPDYGGGIQVYGELTVTENALVTGNFADEFGGGVYLAGGATLYLHADVIRENTVADGSGYGADLYAANGSTIYYNTAIDMTREGFYLCVDVNLIGMDTAVGYADTRKDGNYEIFMNISDKSGYTKEQIAEIIDKLEKKGFTILQKRTDIDTTDLRDWYVYDHYDPKAWAALGQKWEVEYGGNARRGYYPYSESASYCDKTGSLSIVDGIVIDNISTITNPVYTISDWLKRQNDYVVNSLGVLYPSLARFKEHIYTRNESGGPKMTFVGYGSPAYADFLFYNPESNGEKVVDFDVDSSQVRTHTLQGTGFLVNTGVQDDVLSGYLVYYTYVSVGSGITSSAKANRVSIYQLNGVSAKNLHEGMVTFNNPVMTTNFANWEDEMSIQIKATPSVIEVRQQPKSETSDISQSLPVLSYNLSGSAYSGFGPLVKYGGHSCEQSSSFTYSNLRMHFTNPELEPADMLSPLEKADYTQKDTQKYFINLLGNSASEYNDSASFGQYQEYLKMMQSEGIALITDRNTPFEEYLGDNLCEMNQGSSGVLPVDVLVEQISNYIKTKSTTYIEDKLQQVEGDGGLIKADPQMSVGNIWLSDASGKQIRGVIIGDTIPNSGFVIQPMDDITNYYENKDDITIQYEIIKPNGTVVPLLPVSLENHTPPSFVITNGRKQWPAGKYTVRQTIKGSAVHGYAYFELSRSNTTTIEEHTVTINVLKDNTIWNNSGKRFALLSAAENRYLTDYTYVLDGTYPIYEIVTKADGTTEYVNTGVSVSVNGANASARFDYYTVTFHDGDTILNEYGQTVAKNEKAIAPLTAPKKDGYAFNGWSTSADGSTTFDFDTLITAKTDLYATWIEAEHKVTISVQKDDREWPDHGKTFALTANQAETFLTDLEHIPDGDYQIYEIIQNADSTPAYADTNATVTVNGGSVAATVDYYTITFHDGDTILDAYGTIVSKNTKVIALPELSPKDGYAFKGWGTSEDGSTDFDFEKPIAEKTDFYAKWLKTEYKVTIDVKKDDSDWEGNEKEFALLADDAEAYLTDLTRVSNGNYKIYEIKRTADSIDYVDTGVIAEVNDADKAVTVDYYTVTFYDGTSALNEYKQTVLKNKTAVEPSAEPSKEGYNFYRWSEFANADDDREFNFGTPITQKTDLYAKWIKIEEKTFTISVSAGVGGTVSPSGEVLVKEGADQRFIITPNDGYEIDTVLVDGNAVSLENVQFFYRTLSGSVGTELNAAEPETVALESDTAVINPLNDDNNSNTNAKQYIFHTVNENHTLSATFKAIPKKKSAKKVPSSDSTPDAPVINLVKTDTRVISEPIPVPEVPVPVTKDSEPKTDDASPVEVYATIGMIAGLSYLLLYFADGESGMTEEQKKEIVGALVKWARKGKRIRKYVALAIVFVILVYYHSIGKRTTVEWKELYEK